jgi:hypothetical protein
MRKHMSKVIAAGLVGLLTCSGLAQNTQESEYDLLRPGKDDNLEWVRSGKVLETAKAEQKPVLIYFFNSEKTTKNARNMINAQFRVFPDDDVKTASASFLCTMIDLHEHRMEIGKHAERVKLERGQIPDFFETKMLWPTEPCFYFLDYMGRIIGKETDVPSSGSKFVKTLTKLERRNLLSIAKDERDAERAAKKAAREAERRAREEERQRALEEKRKQEEAEEDDGEPEPEPEPDDEE